MPKRCHPSSEPSNTSTVIPHEDALQYRTLLARCHAALATLSPASASATMLPFIPLLSQRQIARLSRKTLLTHVSRLSMDDLTSVLDNISTGVRTGTLHESHASTHRTLSYETLQPFGMYVSSSPHDNIVLPNDAPQTLRHTFALQPLPLPQTPPSSSSHFLRPPSMDAIKESISLFRAATGNNATAQSVCAICARELLHTSGRNTCLTDLPNSQLLRPSHAHPAHVLSPGDVLLYPHAYEGDQQFFACNECLSRLNSGNLPRYALANNMWIGDIPFELQQLSQPEKILISLYVPVAFIYKLYPATQDSTRRWASNKLHRGLRGNVSSYPLDQSAISGFISGVMPNPPEILSATVGVTFVGPTDKLEQWIEQGLPANFIVRRARVAAALRWLKVNNPLYASITISEDRLALLPDHGVPDNILSTTRQSDDVGALASETATYVPADDYNEGDEETLLPDTPVTDIFDHILPPVPDVDATSDGVIEDLGLGHPADNSAPSVIPIQSLGVIDVTGSSVTDSEILAHALKNAAIAHGQQSFDVKRGSDFVNEYARVDPATNLRVDGGSSNPNHLLGAFPYLFPYGMGGFELERDVMVSYDLHARWAIQYGDKRFRKDFHFIFQVFGVLQKRHICKSALLQMSTSAYSRQQALISTLSPQDLFQAGVQEQQKQRFTNPAVIALRNNLKAIRAKVPATDESRAAVRGKIWGMTVVNNPPNLWITINPADTHNPIAQIFAGEDIDLDDFVKTAGPNADTRTQNITSDPYASAKFFHFLINAIFECLFGVKRTTAGSFRRREGLFGFVRGYVGTVEAQGRGSLHLHLLLWLDGSLGADALKDALHSAEFRLRLEEYITQVIHADVDDLTGPELESLPKEKEIGYARPLDPYDTDFERNLRSRTRSFARALQYHTCKTNVCLKVDKKGKEFCKRRAPWDIAAHAWVKASGEWGPKRTAGLMNNFNPYLGMSLMCNHDVKLITSGALTKKVTWYITHYATKKQSPSSNVSALLSKRLAFHQTKFPPSHQNDRDANKKLLQGCANTLSRDRELSAPEVMSYLMGWPDVHTSHHFVFIPWYAAVADLFEAFPALRNVAITPHDNDISSFSTSQTATLTAERGTIRKVDHLADYRERGHGLKDMSFLDFHLHTYEERKKNSDPLPAVPVSPGQGRQLNARFDYLDPRAKPNFCRVMRSPGHETLPNFVGPWFPRSDRDGQEEVYAAAMLLLFKPWRTLHDLKLSHESFASAFTEFKLDPLAPHDLPRLLSNIQYYYDCADDALCSTDVDSDDAEVSPVANGDALLATDSPSSDNTLGPVITEEHILQAKELATPARVRDFARNAIDLAVKAGVFSDKIVHSAPDQLQKGTQGSSITPACVKTWTKTIKHALRTDSYQTTPPLDHATHPPGPAAATPPSVRLVSQPPQAALLLIPTYRILNSDQKRAFKIVKLHLDATLNGPPPEQLLLQIQGRGGTGKSLLIQAITELFEARRSVHLFSKAATSGIAGSQIGGTTVHYWAGIPVGTNTSTSDEIHERRSRNLAQKEYAIIDECSMMDKQLLCRISDAASEARSRHGNCKAHLPFGGLNVILLGDFHQFPPVGNPHGALYVPSKAADKQAFLRGKDIYDQFDKVVILTEQMRCHDARWDALLGRLRVGECTQDDIAELNKLVISNPECDIPDFASSPWDEAVLITPRHAVRRQWNSYALNRHCSKYNKIKFVIRPTDIDTQSRQPASNHARLHIAKLSDADAQRKLEDTVEVAIGMKAMVLENISTEADLANGSRGVVHDIILHPDEPPLVISGGVAHLKHLPLSIILKPTVDSTLRFDGLEPGLLPVMPSSCFFQIPPSVKGGKGSRVKRTQFAITPAYAFTDYKAQGQTVEYVLVDIAKPPTGHITAFSVYVALSRSRGRGTIRLLRPFYEPHFRNHPSQDLRIEMERLSRLNHATASMYSCV